MWYDECEDKKDTELYNLLKECCEWYSRGGKTNISANGLYNPLFRGGIRTVEDLINASPEQIRKIRTIGNGVKFGLIMTLKLELEEKMP